MISDLLLHIMAEARKEKERWKRVSMVCFNVARFGNSDPKKFPSSIKKYMPELWGDEEISDEDPLIQAARAQRQNIKVNGR